MNNSYSSLPTNAGGSGSGSVSTHASMEAAGSTSSTAGAPSSSAAATTVSAMQTPDARRHGLGLMNGESYSSSPSQASSPSYHQYQSSRQAPSSQQNQQYQTQSYHGYQQQQQPPHHHHHHHAASISSSSGFRNDSHDSGLTPTFSSNTIMHSSPSPMGDPSDSMSQHGHASTPVPANASSQILIASIVQRLVNKVSSNAESNADSPLRLWPKLTPFPFCLDVRLWILRSCHATLVGVFNWSKRMTLSAHVW